MVEAGQPANLLDEGHLDQDNRALAAHGGPEAAVQARKALLDDRLPDAAPYARAVIAGEDLDLDDLSRARPLRAVSNDATRRGGGRQAAEKFGEGVVRGRAD